MGKKLLQKPITIDEQLANLKSIGLTINNESTAKQFLNNVSYFRLIKGFSIGLKDNNGMYNKNISFDTIVKLYKFNGSLRHILFDMIERIEINLRCKISNYFSNKYGALGYKDAMNFNNKEFHKAFLSEVGTEINRNKKSPFVCNYKNNYKNGDIPLYALIELFSFGTLSKFYKNMLNEDKKQIAKQYNTTYTYLQSWVECIAYVRNICAHYGRLYNAKFTKKPILYSQYKDIFVNEENMNIRLFGTIICMSHMLPHDISWHEFVADLEILINKNPDVNLSLMSFPPNWLKLLN